LPPPSLSLAAPRKKKLRLKPLRPLKPLLRPLPPLLKLLLRLRLLTPLLLRLLTPLPLRLLHRLLTLPLLLPPSNIGAVKKGSLALPFLLA
jgi:hypothetical protein